ncbi:MAG: hypothetical protein WB808_12380 [Candidatus Dormiibacterota bacterium]
MDADNSVSVDAGAGEGAYLRRAQSLLASHGERFVIVPARSPQPSGAPNDRIGSLVRQAGRQLILPLPRDRTSRRARMMR